MRNFLRSWGLRPHRWGNPQLDDDALPSQMYPIFFSGNAKASQCAPAPEGGRAGASDIRDLKRGFRKSRNYQFFCIFFSSESVSFVISEKSFFLW